MTSINASNDYGKFLGMVHSKKERKEKDGRKKWKENLLKIGEENVVVNVEGKRSMQL